MLNRAELFTHLAKFPKGGSAHIYIYIYFSIYIYIFAHKEAHLKTGGRTLAHLITVKRRFA